MVAFVEGTLPPRSRQRIGRLIDECPECYREYVRVRETLRELRTQMPGLGQPTASQMERIWSGIASTMHTSAVVPAQPPHGYKVSAAAVALLVALLLPLWMFDSHPARAAITLPAPIQREFLIMTHTPTAQAVAVATAVPVQTLAISTTKLQPEAAPQRTPDTIGGN